MMNIPKTYPPLFSSLPVTAHTDYVTQGSTFVAIKGLKEDGVRYISRALEKGATTIVAEHGAEISSDVLASIEKAQASLVRVDNAREALAELSAQASGHAAQKLKIIAITGTKGKTTTAHMLANILKTAEFKTGLISSVFNTIGDDVYDAPMTTPTADYLHQFFAECVRREVEVVVMEVAAQASTMKRVHGIMFDGLIFTNFEPEHSEFYASEDDYFKAKACLFEQLRSRSAFVYNRDDLTWSVPSKKNDGISPIIYTYGFEKARGDKAFIIKRPHVKKAEKNEWFVEASGILFDLHMGSFKVTFGMKHFVGRFNVYNAAAAITMARAVGIEPMAVILGIFTAPSIPGRYELYDLPNGAGAIIDYAHTPASYSGILHEARSIFRHVIVVCGAGGERDVQKRPVLAALAAYYADLVIFTSDNPRSEDPAVIAEQMVAGVSQKDRLKVQVELDREKAIKKAYAASAEGSIIVLLGKGSDRYQIIGSQKLPFDEAAILQSL
jgi:UDP-N-acetylmuramoyl-L-alanyl-D-glutamate--2,6-diaminopimelate ligase